MKLTRSNRAAALCVAVTLFASPAFADYLMRLPVGLNGPIVPGLTLSSANVDFGSVAITESATAAVTLTNPGDTDARFDLVEPEAPFSLTHDCPTSLAPAASCTLTFTFAPTVSGNAAGTAKAAGQEIVLGGYGDAMLATSIAAGEYHSVVLRADGTLWATGRNAEGQLGLGDTTQRMSFAQVAALGTSVAKVAAGAYHTVVLKKDGTLWATGYNVQGQLGLGDTATRNSFVQATSIGGAVTKMMVGGYHTFAVKADGTLWATGGNYYGQLGLGDSADRSSFAQVASMGTSAADVAAGAQHTMALKTDGTLWGAGANIDGQLGLGIPSDRNSSFVQVASMGTEVASVVAGGYHTLALRSDGTMWVTGGNRYGQLGLGDTTNRASFTKAASMDTSAAKILAGLYQTTVVKKDGTMWAAGRNTEGQLGLGDTTNRTSFAQVASMATAAAKIAAGGYHTLVVKSDGAQEATGGNANGQLGLGDTTNRSVFTQVP